MSAMRRPAARSNPRSANAVANALGWLDVPLWLPARQVGTRGLVTRPRWRVTKPLRERIAAGHPWVYDRALEPPGKLAAGDVVTLVDERGPLATALADPASPIRARILDRDPDAACDGAWARGRAEKAAAWRTRDPLLVGCTGRRLVHGEADGCPGLVIDQYADLTSLRARYHEAFAALQEARNKMRDLTASRTLRSLAWSRLKQDKLALAGGVVVVLLILTAILAAPICHLLGIDPHLTIPDRLQRPVPLVEGGEVMADMLI